MNLGKSKCSNGDDHDRTKVSNDDNASRIVWNAGRCKRLYVYDANKFDRKEWYSSAKEKMAIKHH